MKNISYILAGAGLIGMMVGASALDGPDMVAGIAIMAAGLAALGAGDLLIKIHRKEVIQNETAVFIWVEFTIMKNVMKKLRICLKSQPMKVIFIHNICWH